MRTLSKRQPHIVVCISRTQEGVDAHIVHTLQDEIISEAQRRRSGSGAKDRERVGGIREARTKKSVIQG